MKKVWDYSDVFTFCLFVSLGKSCISFTSLYISPIHSQVILLMLFLFTFFLEIWNIEVKKR